MSVSWWCLWVLAASVPLFVSCISALLNYFMEIREWFESAHPLLRLRRKMSVYWLSFVGRCRWWRKCVTVKRREMRRIIVRNQPLRVENVLWAFLAEWCVCYNYFEWFMWMQGPWWVVSVSMTSIRFERPFSHAFRFHPFPDRIHNHFQRNRTLHENVLNIALHPWGVQPVDILPHRIKQQSKGVPALVKE